MPSIIAKTITFTPKRPRGVWGQSQDNATFYKSKAWRNYRANYLAAHPLCLSCHTRGVVKQASHVDHITPINQGGDPWDYSNLQGLCLPCHSAKSARDRWDKEKK